MFRVTNISQEQGVVWWRRVFWLLIVLPQWSSADEVRLSSGVEQFNWEEFADDGRSLLEESGLRQFVELGREAPLNSNWWYEMRGRLYGGRVGYDGETWAGDPVTTDTDYKGIQVELGVTQSTAGDATGATSAKWLFRAAVGIDGWQRLLRDTALADGTPVMGYDENYICYYSSAGLGYTRGSWSANLGVKLPLRIDERVEIGGWSVLLHPEGRLSLMAGVELPINPRWSVALDYDSYELAKSAPQGGVYQPKSTQQKIAVALRYHF